MSSVVRTRPTTKILVPYEASYYGRLLKGRVPVLRHVRMTVEAEVPILSRSDVQGTVRLFWKGEANQYARQEHHDHPIFEGRLLVPTRVGNRMRITEEPFREMRVGDDESILGRLRDEKGIILSTPFFRMPNAEDSYQNASKARTDAMLPDTEGFAEILQDDAAERRAEALRLASGVVVLDGAILSSNHEFVLREWYDRQDRRTESTVLALDILARPSSFTENWTIRALNDPEAPPVNWPYRGGRNVVGPVELLKTQLDYGAIEACRRLRHLTCVFHSIVDDDAFHGSGRLAVPDVPVEADHMLRTAAMAVAVHDDATSTPLQRHEILLETLHAFDVAMDVAGRIGRREDEIWRRDRAVETAERWIAELHDAAPAPNVETDSEASYLGM